MDPSIPTCASAVDFKGLPCMALQLPGGDRLVVTLHGAHVLSWQTADGVERLYLSPNALLDGHSAIRGGVPVCFPQFNQRFLGGRELPKHGFARTLPWTVEPVAGTPAAPAVAAGAPDTARVRLSLADSEATRQHWPFAFAATLDLTLAADRLRVAFAVTNTGSQALPFALALHSYLRVAAIGQVQLRGLHKVGYWDAVADRQDGSVTRLQADEALGFAAETDRVYQSPPRKLQLQDGVSTLQIEQSESCTETVVWNPGAALCAQMADLPPDGYQHMLCVEAAKVNHAVNLAPGQSWGAWQQFTVLQVL